MRAIILVTVLATLATVAHSECANACNGHGKCTSYDMCICNRNWQANDCSERVCQFGLAHVDTPKGDLDMSGALSGPDHPVVDNSFTYPYGSTEQFPQMEDSDLEVLTDSAHYYMECSNKGTCDRSNGLCQCYDGYDGVACQRASCPGYPSSCSGHGVCQTIKQLADADHHNVYKLWDQHSTMGCQCDAGYSGPDCSLRQCKHGVDPLYLDDAATIKYSIFDVATLTTKPWAGALFNDGQLQHKQGYWAIRFFDSFGEDWLTTPIVAGATCAAVVAALEAIPNNVIPAGNTYCTRTANDQAGVAENMWYNFDAQHASGTQHPYKVSYNLSIWDALTPGDQGELSRYTPLKQFGSAASISTKLQGYIYRLKFYGNPGTLREPEIEIHLDGKRPSLASQDNMGNWKVITKVWTDGQQGEDNDYFADHCDGVSVTLGWRPTHNPTLPMNSTGSYLTGFTSAEKALLKACLADGDFDTSNNQDVYNWDKGTKLYPHIIKLVRTVTTYTDGGYYAVIWYDTTEFFDNLKYEGTFRLLNPFVPPDSFATDTYEIYTTKGTLALTSNHSEAAFGFGSKYIYTVNASYDTSMSAYDGDISCEIGQNNAYKMKYIFHCLNKTDMFTVLNWEVPSANPPHINLYTAQRLLHSDLQWSPYYAGFTEVAPALANESMHYMTHIITTDISTNWAGSNVYSGPNAYAPQYHVYKFFPSVSSTYNYVAPCSNRGICDTANGLCTCFPGYTSDSCSEQSSIAL